MVLHNNVIYYITDQTNIAFHTKIVFSAILFPERGAVCFEEEGFSEYSVWTMVLRFPTLFRRRYLFQVRQAVGVAFEDRKKPNSFQLLPEWIGHAYGQTYIFFGIVFYEG